MDPREYVVMQIERTRSQLRAASFINVGKNTLRLGGKKVSSFIADVADSGKNPIEIIDASAQRGEDQEPLEGASVTVNNVFTSKEGIIFDGNNIRFATSEGAIVSPDQYEYLKNNKLGALQIFAESESVGMSVRSIWRSVTRIAREARSDKAKDILYMTVGTLFWEINSGKKEARMVRSPLFLIPVKEIITANNGAKYRIIGNSFKQNGVLRREVVNQLGINIYEGIPDEIPMSDVASVLGGLEGRLSGYSATMRVELDSAYLCILDSQNEGICQTVEKNIEEIAASEITKIFSGNDGKPNCESIKALPIYPLAADQSQRDVIARVMEGGSLYASAPAGTGKSQTAVNITANLVSNGKTVRIMSEKMAANEVYIEYASKIGLDKYCLLLNNNTKTGDIVKQIKKILSESRRYVKTEKARELWTRYKKAVEDYSKLNGDVYDVLPQYNVSLYDLISEASAYDELTYGAYISPDASNYFRLRQKLTELETSCFDIMSNAEFESYFKSGESGDEELDSMLDTLIHDISSYGIDLKLAVVRNTLTRKTAVKAIMSELARKCALKVMEEKGISGRGNRTTAAIYRSLMETSAEMEELYGAIMRQELSKRVAEHGTQEFISNIEKLKNAKVTPVELFRQYHDKIREVCPVIVTTPTAAVNFLYDTGLDRFDTLIVDEASQMPIIAVLPYFDRIGQMIVFGDHMQLGITSAFMKKEDISPEEAIADPSLLDRSVLQGVQGRFPAFNLKYHYRSRTEMLIHVSNKTCYDGMLQVVPDAYVERSAMPRDLGLELVRVQDPQLTKKGGNLTEAKKIVELVKDLLTDKPDGSIGIITFNEIQQDLICDLLEEELDSYTDGEKLWVRSLENAQGKEADYIFVSIGHCRRNRDGSLHKGISEINRALGENRLNVLFTRARCKNYIVVSFDPSELKKSDNGGVLRLYEYLEYALSGDVNEPCSSTIRTVDQALTDRISAAIHSLDMGYIACPRIGTANMSVDIALKKDNDQRYSMGLLMPVYGQTPCETVTKVSVLERYGWKLLPISPAYFLVSYEKFKTQLERIMDNPTSFYKKSGEVFETTRCPGELFTLNEFGVAKEEGVEVSSITTEEFFSMDIEGAYRGVLSEELFAKSTSDLNLLAKSGDNEASLLLLIRLRKRFFEENKKRALISTVSRMYSGSGEKRAGYYLAQLLRVDTNTDNNQKLINTLFTEANKLGIGGNGSAKK